MRCWRSTFSGTPPRAREGAESVAKQFVFVRIGRPPVGGPFAGLRLKERGAAGPCGKGL